MRRCQSIGLFSLWFISLAASQAAAQTTRLLQAPTSSGAGVVREPADTRPRLTVTPVSNPRAPELTPATLSSTSGGLKISKGSGTLPNDHGQVWREYDISPYTSRIADVERPQQAIIDWILRDTGTDVWFSEPVGILSASSTTLRVYHTPQMQLTVRAIVERFVASDAESHVLGLKLVTVASPDWRATAIPMMKPIEVKSAGVEAWLLSRENAAMLHEALKSRSDFRQQSAERTEVQSGQLKVLTRTQPRRYSRTLQRRSDGLGFELIPGQIDEGYSLEISSLMSLDGRTAEVAIACRIDQVEKLVPVAVEAPVVGQSNRVQIQVPQVVSWRLSERFQWPAEEVLLLSCGVVANPAANSAGPLAGMNPFGASKPRADALLFIDHRAPTAEPLTGGPVAASTDSRNASPTNPGVSRGRY